jgi:signal transduction histidine kinase
MHITDYKQTEVKLKETETKYLALLAAIPDLVLRISRNGEYLEMRRPEQLDFPYPSESLIGKKLGDILSADVAQTGVEAIAETLNSGTCQIWEHQITTNSGVRHYQARLIPHGNDEVLAIMRDVTNCKSTVQVNLAAQRDRILAETLSRIRSSLDLEAILQTTVTEVRQFLQVDRVFVGLHDSLTAVRTVAESVDPQYPSILGWSTHDTVFIQELRGLFAANCLRVVEDISKISHELPPKLKKHYQEMQTRATLAVPIILKAKLLGVLVAHQCRGTRVWESIEIDLLQQISQQLAIAIQQSLIHQKMAQLNSSLERQVAERTTQLQQKMQELERIQRIKDVTLHTVAHDLRTAVMGNLMVVQHFLHTRQLRKCQNSDPALISISDTILERMIQGNERQLGMIDSLLEIHYGEKQGITLNCQKIAFNNLISTILCDLEPLFQRNQATINHVISSDIPTVFVDICRLQKVFASLFTHSLQHNPPGLNLLLKAEVNGEMIYTQIQDNGATMSKRECDRLFDLYVRDPQAPCSTSIGLKLYLCRQIIRAHGGEIGVVSKQQNGLTFWFTLPIAS